MSDMQTLSGRIREFNQTVEFFLFGIGFRFKTMGISPLFLPFFLNFMWIILSVHVLFLQN